jgi:hypothetical protein
MTNNDLQNTTQKTEDRTIGTALKTMGEHKCFGRVSSSWSTCGTRRAALLTNLVRSHERGKDGLWLRQTKHMRGYLWHRYFVTDKQVVATVKLLTNRNLDSVASLLAPTIQRKKSRKITIFCINTKDEDSPFSVYIAKLLGFSR